MSSAADNPLRKLGGNPKSIHSDNIIQSQPPLVASVIDISVKVPWKCSRIKVLKTTTDHVVAYNSRDLSLSRAVCAISYSFLSQRKNWVQVMTYQLLILLAYLVTASSGTTKSLSDIELTTTLQLLLTFILAAYVGLALNRWDAFRHEALHPLFIGMENVVLSAYRVFNKDSERHRYLRNCIYRYSRSSFKAVIMAMNGKWDLTPLCEDGWLKDEEIKVLADIQILSRPMTLVAWIYRIFDIAVEEKIIDCSEYKYSNSLEASSTLRDGIGATIARNGTETPYMYTHLIYWTVQMLLIILSIETGVNIAIMEDRRVNGAGEYVFPSDYPETWPVEPKVWFKHITATKCIQNLFLSLFMEGILKFCDSIQHPLSEKSESFFPMDYFDTLFNNDCGAIVEGMHSFDKFTQPRSLSATTSK